jgi:homoserine kinase type II
MAVYTKVSTKEAQALLRTLNLGQLTALQACAGGIENTNYFVSAEQDGQVHDYVLTLFERLTHQQLPFYLRLMNHLAERDIPVPKPHANAHGELVLEVKGKPAAVVNKLRGKSVPDPGTTHCSQVGATLARMHIAGRDFDSRQPNLRALPWWNETVPVVLPYLNDTQAAMIQRELAFQNHVAASSSYAALPRGPVHADLFRDNVMFDHAAGVPELSGFLDFYFAGEDTWIFDLAVCLNDWCIDQKTLSHQTQLAHYFIASYNAVRPLQAAERELLPAMLRAGALRFWISRLWDFYLPREASVLKAHDPGHFEQVLLMRSNQVLSFEELAADV